MCAVHVCWISVVSDVTNVACAVIMSHRNVQPHISIKAEVACMGCADLRLGSVHPISVLESTKTKVGGVSDESLAEDKHAL